MPLTAIDLFEMILQRIHPASGIYYPLMCEE